MFVFLTFGKNLGKGTTLRRVISVIALKSACDLSSYDMFY